MNRAERRRLARANGWHGNRSGKGRSMADALAQATREAELREQQAYMAKIQEAARRTRDMGLFIPGQ